MTSTLQRVQKFKKLPDGKPPTKSAVDAMILEAKGIVDSSEELNGSVKGFIRACKS